MTFSKPKEVKDTMYHHLKASNPSTKFHEYFVDAKIYVSTNLNPKFKIH